MSDLRDHLEQALRKVGAIDPLDGTVPQWDYERGECPLWRTPDRLLDALEEAVSDWLRPSSRGRHRKDDSSIWLG